MVHVSLYQNILLELPHVNLRLPFIFSAKLIKTELFAGGRKEKNAVLISVPSNLDPKWASECFKIQNVGHQCGWLDRIVNQLLFIKQSINQLVFIEALNRAFQSAFPIKGETDVKHSAHV